MNIEAVNFIQKYGPMAGLYMDQLAVSGDVPLHVAVSDITKYGGLEMYATVDFHGWAGINATVCDYVKYVIACGHVLIFGQKVTAYVRRNAAGDAIGFEIRLGV